MMGFVFGNICNLYRRFREDIMKRQHVYLSIFIKKHFTALRFLFIR